MKFKTSKLVSAIFFTGALSLLGGCSSTIELKEPPKEAINSELTLDRVWKVTLSTMPNGDTRGLAIAQDEERLFVASSRGFVAGLTKQSKSRWTDQVLWQMQLDEIITAGPAYDTNRILIGTAKGRLKAINAQTGQIDWQVQLSSEVLGKPVVEGNSIYTRTADGKIYNLNRQDGTTVWVAEHQMPSLSLRGAPQVLPTHDLVYVAWETGTIQALSTVSGEVQWEARVATPSGRTDLERMVDIQANLQLKDDVLYAIGFHGKLVAINVLNGNFIFLKDVSGYRDFVVDDSGLYAVDEDDVLYAFDHKSGAPLWKQESMKGRFIGDMSLYKDNLLLTDMWGYVHWINKLQGTESSRFKFSDEYGTNDRAVRVAIDDNALYLFDNAGTITRYNVRPSDYAEFTKKHGTSLF